jgi:hypothetical protein
MPLFAWECLTDHTLVKDARCALGDFGLKNEQGGNKVKVTVHISFLHSLLYQLATFFSFAFQQL